MKKIWTVLPLAGMALSACVTINIPAAAAEKAADKIIDEVWQTDKSATTQKSDKSLPVTPDAKKEKAI